MSSLNLTLTLLEETFLCKKQSAPQGVFITCRFLLLSSGLGLGTGSEVGECTTERGSGLDCHPASGLVGLRVARIRHQVDSRGALCGALWCPVCRARTVILSLALTQSRSSLNCLGPQPQPCPCPPTLIGADLVRIALGSPCTSSSSTRRYWGPGLLSRLLVCRLLGLGLVWSWFLLQYIETGTVRGAAALSC